MATKRRPASRKVATRPAPVRATITSLAPGDVLPVGSRDKGITIGDWIVDQVKRGAHPFHAASACGVLPSELQAWSREGALVLNRCEAGADWDKDFTTEQQDQAIFAARLNSAFGLALTRTTLAIENHIAGGQEVVKVIEVTDRRGKVIETRRTTTRRAPNLDAAKWKLERIAADVFGAKATVNLTVTDLTDSEGVKSTLEQRMDDILARMGGQQVIDATATEDPPAKPTRRTK